jgi:hypothetical protein
MALDANFRLKCKERGLSTDSSLGEGWGYFVDHRLFEKELERLKIGNSEQEVRNTSQFYYHLINEPPEK